MSTSIRQFLKNAVYTFSANATSFVINALIVLIIPKLIGVADYGYFQLYVLLATYALYFHFGWCDGIYLRYVGKDYRELDRELLSSQFKGILLLSSVMLVALLAAVRIGVDDVSKRWVYSWAAVVVFLVTPKTYTSVIMQATNRMKEYAQIVLAEKVVYVVILSGMLLCGIRDFGILILSDVAGKLAALLMGVVFCRKIVTTQTDRKQIGRYWAEAKVNIRVGAFLLISNLASLMITGLVQFFVEAKWDIETFSKVSLTFNMSKMLMVVITAMSIVMVPMLKHMEEDKLSKLYGQIRSVIGVVLGAMLACYYPMKLVLSIWLPQYTLSLQYMALLFPMCLFESKTQLLINTYMKAMRKEKVLCSLNILTVSVSAVIAGTTVFLMGNLDMTILMIPYLLAFRCIIMEVYIGKKLKLRLLHHAIAELMLCTIFIAVSWYIQSWLSLAIYLGAYLIYAAYAGRDMRGLVKEALNPRKLV